jgi:hypothetical protein
MPPSPPPWLEESKEVVGADPEFVDVEGVENRDNEDGDDEALWKKGISSTPKKTASESSSQ